MLFLGSVPTARRQPGLDLLRAIAIIWVMLFHTQGLDLPFHHIARFGWMGVDLFFVLSGYLIGSQLLRPCLAGSRPSLYDFYLRRSLRVLPAFLVVLTLYFTVPLFRESPHISPPWYFLTFSENFQIDYFNTRAFSHVWSLCVEEHFYLVLPLLVLGMMRMRKPGVTKTVAVIAAILIGGMALRGYIYLHQLQPLLDSDSFPTLYIEKIYYPTYCRLDGLLIGVVLAIIKTFRQGWWTRLLAHGYALLFVGIALCAAAMYLFRDRFSLEGTIAGFPLLSIGLGLLLASCLSNNNPLSRYKIPGAGITATLAYSLYLTHKQIVHLCGMYLKGYVGDGGFRALAIYAVATLAAAGLLYLVIERPFLKLRERISESNPIPQSERPMAQRVAAG